MALFQPDQAAGTDDPAAEATTGVAVAAGTRTPRRARGRAPRTEAKLDIVFWLSVFWTVVVLFCALFCNVLHLQPTDTPSGPPSAGPSWAHPFGTDNIGIDLFSLCVHGARMATIIAVSTAALGLVVGGLSGLVAAFYHGVIEQVLMWITDVMLAFPALVFALAVVSFAGASLTTVVLTIAILGIPGFVRVGRALTLSHSQRPFVLASQAMGARRSRTMFREVLPNVIVPLATYAALAAALAIIAEGALAFLGLSAPEVVDWGAMINQGKDQLYQAPQAAFAPMLVMFLTIVSLNFLGERLGAVLDPRQGQL
jgi:peptide/nickel transport system permease protein